MPTDQEVQLRDQVNAVAKLIETQLDTLPLTMAVDVFREVTDRMFCRVANRLDVTSHAQSEIADLRRALTTAENALAMERAGAVHS